MVKTHKSFCRFCHVFCGIEVDVDVEKNRAIAVRPDRDNAVSGGYTCRKGRAELERIYHPERLMSSKKRIEEQNNQQTKQRTSERANDRTNE